MPAFVQHRSLSSKVLLVTSVALLIIVGAIFSASHVRAQQPTATYTDGKLAVILPYHSTRAGSGSLTIEIVDPEDHILGRFARGVDVTRGDGAWQQVITPQTKVPFDEIVWQRVRYRFEYGDEKPPAIEGVEAIAQILRRPVIHILGQTEYMAGSPAAIRVVVSDAHNNDVIEKGDLRIDLIVPDQKPRPLFTGRLNNRGTVQAQFSLPGSLTGQFEMRFVADTPIGSTEFTQPVTLADKVSVLLTTEKPTYQPGQTVHIRALALDRASHKAETARSLTFEVEDSRGNKVFKDLTTTDKFGIASAEFSLADEVNLGTYHLRALLGDPSSPSNTSEVSLNVERYVLPKFKVSVEFASKDNKPKRDYRPGDHVTGTIRANYFFGKPVDHAAVTVKASSMDVAVFEAASAAGQTDKDGAYHFDLQLPDYFAGRPINQGAARVLIEATVKDSAAHTEARGEPVTVSQSPLLITVVPEGGVMIPHLENEVFVVTSYADGTPARTDVRVYLPGAAEQDVSTDPGGVAVIRLNPGAGMESIRIDADDHRGSRTSSEVPLQTREGDDQILLRTARTVLKAGDPIVLRVLSTRSKGAAYVDIVRDGQTIVTRDVDLQNGRADLTLTATPEMAGTLDINAYVFGQNAQPVADHRLVFVQPADELKIATSTDAPVYKPGSDARIQFRVTNSRGDGVSAALGLQVVDEAVFALAEKQPGFAKVFFYLEQEVMKSRYEIHSLSLPSLVEPRVVTENHQYDTDARALFAATEMAAPTKLDVEFGRTLPQEKFSEYQQRYREAFVAQVRRISAGLGQKPKAVDAWGTPLRIEPAVLNHLYSVRSAGPDHQFDNADDLITYVDHSGRVVENPDGGGWIDLKMEHDRGAFNGRAEITGTVTDATGAVIPRASITLRWVSAGRFSQAQTDAAGQFTFAGVTPGRYEAEISAPGFERRSRDFTLQARDRAILSTALCVGSSSQTVEVVAMAAPLPIAGRSYMAIATGSLAIRKTDPVAPTHVRSYFPEALYINPEIITDAQGNASISIPIADSITTWRMAMLASTQSGALGSGVAAIKVFQDFFVDLDLPVTLTQGDRVSIPIAAYNYSGMNGRVNLKIKREDWFDLEESDSKAFAVESGRVGASQFTIAAKRIGKFKLTLSAHMDGEGVHSSREDIVVREIEVVPNGREQNLVFNGRLETSVQHDLKFPAGSIPEASSILVRLYPGPLSQVIEGMDSILTMPGGCFEQTSSSTYPNVLALDYMKRTKKLTPEVHAKAVGYISNGYQRLLTFEVPGGGFSWFGQAPANKILTAYGLMEFSDMSKVSDIDARLIDRTRDWLAGQQQPDGSWKPDTSFINEGATNRYNSDVLRITAYIAWSLANSGYQGPAIDKAKQYVESHSDGKSDTYTLAVIANFAADYEKDRDFTRRSMQALIDARTEANDLVWWTADETGVYSTGTSAAIETTGLATQALLNWGNASETVRKALNYISSKKEASGAWGTTQATIMALRSLLLASEMSKSDVRGSIHVFLNGKPVQSLKLTAGNNDLLHQFVFKGIDAQKPASVSLAFEGSGGLAYQVVGRYFTPWDEKPAAEPLSIDISYDRTKLARNDTATATVKVRNNLDKTANMVMVDLGIPPGFDLLTEDLQAFQEKTAGTKAGALEKFSLTATQAILYFNALSPHQNVALEYRLRAKYPIRARTFQSRVYEYYDPDVSSIARPVQLEVTEH
jgi:uncharacterized protein YfaS (alpha-2-macroglobulin family)